MSMFRRKRAKSVQPGTDNDFQSPTITKGHSKSPSKAETKLEKQALERSNTLKADPTPSRRRLTEPFATPDDLFLNLASDDSPAVTPNTRELLSRSEKLKDRVSRLSRRPNSRDKAEDGKNASLPATPTSATSQIPNESQTAQIYTDPKLRPLQLPTRLATGDGPRSAGPAVPSLTHSRKASYRPSNLAYNTGATLNLPSPSYQENGLPSAASTAQSQQDGTESLDSNTAPPSTVWDELEELKTRIRQLELSGARIKPNGEYSDDRPYTATTATTSSLSPQRKQRHQSAPIKAFDVSGSLADLHPVLRSALFKARQVVEPEVYKALEVSANDALEMAMLARTAEQEDETVYASLQEEAGAFNRRLRRKADNMCRSITELCIALCEDKASLISPTQEQFGRNTSRPGSREKPMFPHQMAGMSDNASDYSPLNYIDRNRAERGTMKPQSKLLSRNGSSVDSRSVLSGSNAPSAYSGRRHSVHRDALSEVSEGSHSPARGALRRAATTDSREHLSLPRSRHGEVEGSVDDNDDPTLRGLSRPSAEIYRSPVRSSSKSYYTSRHPLPDAASVTSSAVSARENTQQQPEYNLSRASLGSQSTITQRSAQLRDRGDRELRAGNVGARLPPSTSADLAERLAQRRKMRALSSEQTTPTSATFRNRTGQVGHEEGSSVTSGRTGTSQYQDFDD